MARRIASVGRVTVSERRSMRSGMAAMIGLRAQAIGRVGPDRRDRGFWSTDATWSPADDADGGSAQPVESGLEVFDAERLAENRDVRAGHDLHRQRRRGASQCR
jgi:hypothetical protein